MRCKRKPRCIHVHGRRWFEQTNGNTYHSVDVWVDGEHVHRTAFAYGYGSQYRQTADDALDALGYLRDRETYSNGTKEALWSYCQRKGINLVDDYDDVPRKKDL